MNIHSTFAVSFSDWRYSGYNNLKMSSTVRTLTVFLLFTLSLAVLSVGIHILTAGNTLGGDYYVSYLGGRAALNGEDPYSDAIAIQVQLAMHKKLAGPGEDQLAFANPPFALLPQLPILWLPFEWSQAVWMAFSILATFFMLISATPGRPRPVMFSLFVLYPFAFGIILGNYSILIFAILAWLFSRLSRPTMNVPGIQAFAGFLLAWSLVKPQFSWVFCGFLLILAWRRREKWLIISFVTSLMFFLGISFLLVPNWPTLWLERLQKYVVYNQTWLGLEFFTRQFLSPLAAQIMSWSFLTVLAVVGIFLGRAWWQRKQSLLLVWGWAGLFGFLAHPRGKSYEHLVFLLPVLSWLLLRASRRKMPVWIFWGGSVVLSWLAFFMQRSPDFPPAVAEAPLLVLPLWMLWIMRQPPQEIPAEPALNPV